MTEFCSDTIINDMGVTYLQQVVADHMSEKIAIVAEPLVSEEQDNARCIMVAQEILGMIARVNEKEIHELTDTEIAQYVTVILLPMLSEYRKEGMCNRTHKGNHGSHKSD